MIEGDMMNRLYRLISILLLIALLSACGQKNTKVKDPPPPQVLVGDEHIVEPSPTPDEKQTEVLLTEEPQGKLPPPPEHRTQYKLDLTLDYYSKFGNVTENILYTNRTDTTMDEILLLVPPRDFANAYHQQGLTGDRVASFREDGVRTYVKLDPPLAPLESTNLNIIFRLVPPAHEGVFGQTNRQLNLSDWYPLIPPYNPETGWIAYNRITDHNNIIIGEYVVQETADFEVSLTLINQPELIEVAASAPAVEVNGVRHYSLPTARAFAFSISDSYFEHEIVHNGTRIRTYLFMNHRDKAEAICEIARQALALYEELFYPYPREMISIVAGDFLHNMEMDGMFMLSHKVIDFHKSGERNNLTILTAHELLHQWFYSLIGNNSFKEPWLDEAMATYAEALYFERYHPESVDWWWRNRVTEYSPSGYVNSNISEIGDYESYRGAVYLNGALFFRDLRNTVGDEAFFAALKEYAIVNTWKIANRDDFFKAFSNHSDTNLSGLMYQYFSQ